MAFTKKIELKNLRCRTQRIQAVGLELEGGWSDIPKGVRYDPRGNPGPYTIGRDGSLDHFQQRNPELAAVGEIASEPLPVGSKAEEWLRRMWPQRIGENCAFHIHMSFINAICYSRLMKEEYPGTAVEYLRRWAEKEGLPKTHAIWPRLNGDSVYCQHIYSAADQIGNVTKDRDQRRKGHRYTAFNYNFGRTGTIECRLLPMFDNVEQGIRALNELVDLTNRFLLTDAKKEKKYEAAYRVAEPSTIRSITFAI